MKKRGDIFKFCSIIGAVLVGLVGGGFFFGMIIHEESHAVACLLFRVPIVSWSFDRVVYETSPSNYVNVLIGLAGGLGQALASLVFFLYARSYLVKYGKNTILQKEGFEERSSILADFTFGFEASFLAIAFHGIINSLVEGFFHDIYVGIHSDSLIWLGILALSLAVASFILYSHQHIYLK
jgi:hypothetical protein